MSSSDLDAGVGPLELPAYMTGPLTAPETLFVMDWKGLDIATHDLGGVIAPAAPQEALRWLEGPARGLSPDRRFLAAYKAMWDARGLAQVTALLTEMQRAKIEAELSEIDFDVQAAMALGIALATWQGEMFRIERFRPRLWEDVTPAKVAGASLFAEAVRLTRFKVLGRHGSEVALAAALRSAFAYSMEYPGVEWALRRALSEDDFAWLERREE